MFYLKCSQFEKSVTVFEEEVSNLRALGQNDLQVAESVSALARLYAHLGIFSYAEACLAEMKQIRYDCAADCTDREVFDSHLSTGIVLRAQGKLAESSMEFGLAVRCLAKLRAAPTRRKCDAHAAGVQGGRVRPRAEVGERR